jgi:hypothetical protein
MMEAKRSSETSVLTKAMRRNIPGDGILRVDFSIMFKALHADSPKSLHLILPVAERYVWWQVVELLSPHTNKAMRKLRIQLEEQIIGSVQTSPRLQWL